MNGRSQLRYSVEEELQSKQHSEQYQQTLLNVQ